MPGLAHLYIGEEAVAVGVCEALHRDDYITSTHRGHGHCLAKGASRRPHVCRAARQGSGLLPGQGRLDAHRRPGHRQPGRQRHRRRQRRHRHRRGLSAKRRGTGQVAVCFFGEGALGQGVLYEEMNMAAAVEAARHLRLREQPVQRVHPLQRDDCRRASVRGRRPSASYGKKSMGRMCARSTRPRRSAGRACPRGEGPAFLLCHTYRYHGHHVGDINRAYYRSQEEEET